MCRLIIVTVTRALLGSVMGFASFGFAPPRNRAVVTTWVVLAFLVAVSLQLLPDMDGPFDASIRVASDPVQWVPDCMAG